MGRTANGIKTILSKQSPKCTHDIIPPEWETGSSNSDKSCEDSASQSASNGHSGRKRKIVTIKQNHHLMTGWNPHIDLSPRSNPIWKPWCSYSDECWTDSASRTNSHKISVNQGLCISGHNHTH